MKKFLPLILVFLFSSNAISAVKTWDGGGTDANWNNPVNWVNDVGPVANDDLVFPVTSAQFSTNNNFFLFTSFRSITIEGGNYTIGGNPLRLTDGLNINGGTPVINTALSLSSPQTFSSVQGSTTTIAILSISAGSVTFNGEGSFGIGLISGSGSIIKNGSGAVLLVAASGFNGAITVNNGIFVADASIPGSSVLIDNPTISGGTLALSGFGGTGTVGTVNVNQGAISAGTLTSPTGILNTGNLTFTPNGIYACKIGGVTAGANGHDQVNVSGIVNLSNARLAPIPWGGYRSAIGDSFTILKNDGTDAINGTFLNAPEGGIFSGALNTAFRITYLGGDGNDVVITRIAKSFSDFDGDGKTDLATFRPANGLWSTRLSGSNSDVTQTWGSGTDKIVPVDFDGDNRTDLAIFRDGVWWIFNSLSNSVTTLPFGASGDIPLPNDFDGDGRADIAVFRPSDGVWYQLRSLGNQFFAQQFGAIGDIPQLVDFDGDGFGELSVFRPADGTWHFYLSSNNAYTAFPFGTLGDKPIAADYDGDGKTDVAVFRAAADPNQPDFYVLLTANSAYYGVSWGDVGDIPVVGDYDGDGKSDVAVFRPNTNDWFLLRSTAGFGAFNFGQNGDRAVPSAFVP